MATDNVDLTGPGQFGARLPPEAFVALLPRLPDRLLPQAVSVALSLHGEPIYGVLIQGLAERLHNAGEATLRQSLDALQDATQDTDVEWAVGLLELLIPILPLALTPSMMELVMRLGEVEPRARLLTMLCRRCFPNEVTVLIEEALQAARHFKGEAWHRDVLRAETLKGLVSALDDSTLTSYLDLARDLPAPLERAVALGAAAVAVSGNLRKQLLREALKALRQHQERVEAATALCHLAQHLPDPARSRLHRDAADLLMFRSRSTFEYSAFRAISLLPAPLRNRVIAVELDFIQRLPERSVERDYSGQPSPRHPRKETLHGFEQVVPQGEALPPHLGERLLATVESVGASSRASLFEDFLPLLPPPFVGRVARAIEALPADDSKVRVLMKLASLLPADESVAPRVEAWQITQSLAEHFHSSPSVRASEMSYRDLSPAYAFQSFINNCPEVLVPSVVQWIELLPASEDKDAILEAAVPHLAAKSPESSLRLAHSMRDSRDQAHALSRAFPYLPTSIAQQAQVLLWEAVRRCERGMRPHKYLQEASYEWVSVVREAAPHLSLFLEELLLLVEAHQGHHDEAMLALAPHLPPAWRVRVANQLASTEAPREQALETDSAFLRLRELLPLLPIAQQNALALTEVGRWLDELDDANDTRSEDDLNSTEVLLSPLKGFEDLVLVLSQETLRELLERAQRLPDQQVPRRVKALLLAALSRLSAQVLRDAARPSHEPRPEWLALLREAIALTFSYAYFPEGRGNGEEEKPAPVSLTPEQMLAVLDQMAAPEQMAFMGGAMARLAEQLGARLPAVAKSLPRSMANAPAALQSPVQTRILRGGLPAQVAVGERTTVQVLVALDTLTPITSGTRLAPSAISPSGTEFVLLIDAPGFDVLSEQSQKVRVRSGSDSGWVAFVLRARSLGPQALRVSALLEGTHLGTLELQTEVVPLISQARSSGREPRLCATKLSNQEPQPGEATWRVGHDSERRVLRFSFAMSGVFETHEITSDAFARPMDEGLETIIEAIEEGGSASDLRDYGIHLWQRCVPEELQRLFWEYESQIQQLTILGDAFSVPWELLHPWPAHDSNKRNDASRFLVERFPLSRWRFGMSGPRHLSWSTPCLVLPKSEMSMQTEVHIVRRLMQAVREDTPSIVTTLEELLERLDASDFDWLHLCGHNFFSPEKPLESLISFPTGAFKPLLLSRYASRFERLRPLIFLNACRSAGVAPVLTRSEGWPTQFLEAGAGGFVGTLWGVDDRTALHFATHCYESLASGQTLGQAVYQARLAAKEEGAHPSWLSYCLYGNLSAQVTSPSTA